MLFSCGGSAPVDAASQGANVRASAAKPTPAAWIRRASFGRDPIVLPDGNGRISRAEWRAWLCRRLAKPWLEMLAIDRALASELGYEPARALVGHCRRLVRSDEVLVDVQPARNGKWASAKVQHDLAWCLARLWLLRRGDRSEELPKAEELVALFRGERAARTVSLDATGATCEGCLVDYEEVYPDILALRSAVEREELLREAVRETKRVD